MNLLQNIGYHIHVLVPSFPQIQSWILNKISLFHASFKKNISRSLRTENTIDTFSLWVLWPHLNKILWPRRAFLSFGGCKEQTKGCSQKEALRGTIYLQISYFRLPFVSVPGLFGCARSRCSSGFPRAAFPEAEQWAGMENIMATAAG